MENFNILSFIVISPLFAALLVIMFLQFTKKHSELISYSIVVIISILQITATLVLFSKFDKSSTSLQFVETIAWIKNSHFLLGIDGLSIYFILLTNVLIPICITMGVRTIKNNRMLFMVLFLLLQTFVLGVFCAQDIILFYIFFEAILIPMYIIIGVWGGKNRNYASIKFFIYTAAGSLLMLLAICYIVTHSNTTSINLLYDDVKNYPVNIQRFIWLAFFISFAIKIPMVPFHTWLPDAHVQAPTSGSIILAGILLKVGGYGLLRFNLPMFYDISMEYKWFVIFLSIVAVIYTSMVAFIQKDMKKLIAYSSIAHMGYTTAGIFSFNIYGIQGAILHMISHGIVSSGLFFSVGFLYDQRHTKEISAYQGLAFKMPRFSLFFTILVMSSIGLPLTSGFIGEFLVLVGLYKQNWIYAMCISTGIVLSAAYMLWLYVRIIFGGKTKSLDNMQDIKNIDFFIMMIFSFFIIFIGLLPKFITEYSRHFAELFITKYM